jgi:hypothetical protein
MNALITLFCLLPFSSATLKVHALFSDHVVLQTVDDGGPGTSVSGTGIAGEVVSLSGASDSTGVRAFQSTATVDSTGNWVMPLKLKSGGPFTLKLIGSESKETLMANDALVGDVYICSGQVCPLSLVFGSLVLIPVAVSLVVVTEQYGVPGWCRQ